MGKTKKQQKPTKQRNKLEEQQKTTSNQINVKQIQTQFSIREAPTPPPNELRELQQIDPTFPERLIKMSEKEQSFRHIATYLGQTSFIIVVLGGYAFAAYAGKFSPVVGTTIAIGVSYIAYVFKTKEPKPPKKS